MTNLTRNISKWARHVGLHDGDVIVISGDVLQGDALEKFVSAVKSLHHKDIVVVCVPEGNTLEGILALNHLEMNKLGWYHVSQTERRFHARLEVVRPEKEAYEPKESKDEHPIRRNREACNGNQ